MEQKTQIQRIYIVPLRTCPIFPGMLTTIEVTDPLDMQAIEKSASCDGFGLLLLKPNNKETNDITSDDFYSIGTFVRVKNQINTVFGTQSLFVDTICRFRVLDIFNNEGVFSATVEFINEKITDPTREQALLSAMKTAISKSPDKGRITEDLRLNSSNIQDAIKLGDYLISTIIPEEKQQFFLEMPDPEKRIIEVLKHMNQLLDIHMIQMGIQSEISKNLDKHQKEIILREEYKVVKRRLEELNRNIDENGEIVDLSNSDIQEAVKNPPKGKLIDRLKNLNLTGEVYDTVFGEYSKLMNLEPANPEYSVIRTYLETVADLPWNTMTEENFSIEDAKRILEEDHYGIKDVKDRIIEFLAVKKLKKDSKGSIICLIGPPGTGKTSVGVSIARALNKKYYRFSVGGMRDEAEIKGHRRTYIGAMPGQIVKGLKITKTKNPVFVIDEIDKMTVSNQGDPASALLEVLDPEQNTTFRDHYLDVPFDVSNVLFIVTANSTETIPRPLLDRMECIEMSGYTSEEKLFIGKKYLVPKSRAKHGLKAKDVKYTDSILRKIAEEYAREAGVRNFEKALDRIHRKIAMEIVTGTVETPVKITNENLVHYLDEPVFREDELIKADKPGMSIGLAWTSMGGDVLAVEAQHIPGKGELKLTGQLGDVMKESANIALSYIKSIAAEHNIKESWFNKNSIHLHVPEGATPKDGPSAGITMATAMYSLITGQIMAPNMAMTGELSLLGKVMPIGGLKEKILAAKRNKIKFIIIPKHNERDLNKLDENVRKGVRFFPVSDMEEVLKIAFPYEKNDDF